MACAGTREKEGRLGWGWYVGTKVYTRFRCSIFLIFYCIICFIIVKICVFGFDVCISLLWTDLLNCSLKFRVFILGRSIETAQLEISAFHTGPSPYFTKPFPAPKLPISHYFSHFATTNFLALRNSNMHNSALHSPSQTCYYFFITFTTIECHFYTNKPTKWAVGKFISLALARSTRN